MSAIRVFEHRMLAEAWLEVARRILSEGSDASYDAQPTKELVNVTAVVAELVEGRQATSR
jgi:hypothetical protein